MIKASIVAICITTTLLMSSCNSLPRDSEKENEALNAHEKDQTTKDLEHALSGESEANRKYTAFAVIADQQGYPQVARLWRAAAAAEAIHAKNHMKALGLLKSTEQNLEGAVEGEQYEFAIMYPNFIKTAQAAGRIDAVKSMDWAFQVEQLHHKMFQADLDDLKKGQHPMDVAYWVCDVCGNTVAENAPEKCNICGAAKSHFFEVK